MKQHIHHAEIKAWADGAEIEVFDPQRYMWRPAPFPTWSPYSKYRVKPPQGVVRYKRFLWRIDGRVGLEVALADEQFTDGYPEDSLGFIRWIDNDWQEEVV